MNKKFYHLESVHTLGYGFTKYLEGSGRDGWTEEVIKCDQFFDLWHIVMLLHDMKKLYEEDKTASIRLTYTIDDFHLKSRDPLHFEKITNSLKNEAIQTARRLFICLGDQDTESSSTSYKDGRIDRATLSFDIDYPTAIGRLKKLIDEKTYYDGNKVGTFFMMFKTVLNPVAPVRSIRSMAMLENNIDLLINAI